VIGGFGQCREDRARYRLKGLISKACLVDPPRCSVPHVGISIGQLSIWHSGNLVLDVQSETALKLYH